MADARASRRRESIEALLLAAIGGIGLIMGARALRPAQVVPARPPSVEPPLGGWPRIAEHADGVVRYTLQAKLDPASHEIDGHGTITLKNSSSIALNDLRLHLYLNAFKNDRTVFRRARVGGFRGDRSRGAGYIDIRRLSLAGEDLWPKREWIDHRGDTPQDPHTPNTAPIVEGAPDDQTDVRIPLPKPLPAGESITLEVDFHDRLPEVTERTGYEGSFHFAGQWFPKLARLEKDGRWASFPFHHLAEFYADYGSFDVTLDVPETFTIGASGPVVSSKVEAGRRIERHVIDDVHDFAWTAWDRFVAREQRIEGVLVRFLAPPGYGAAIDREALAVEHALRDKNARFGAYPYPVLTVVHPPDDADEAGGMEYPTLITTGGPWWPNHGLHEIEGVTIHELGHQWFYGLVGTHEVEWPAGDEGFNSYADELALGTLFGRGSGVTLGPLQLSTEMLAVRGVDASFDEPIFQPAHRFASGRSYGGRVYGATAAVLLTLRRTFGAAKLDTAMGVWTRKFRFQHPGPEDFFAVLGEHVGADCEAAARTAFSTPFSYDVYAESLSSEKDRGPVGYFDGKDGRVKKEPEDAARWKSSAWIGRRGALDLPVDVELRFADGSRTRRTIRFGAPAYAVAPAPPMIGADVAAIALGVPVAADTQPSQQSPSNGTWYRLDADGPTQLVAVIVDPDHKLLVDRDRLDNFASLSNGRGGAPIARERSLAWIGVLTRLVGP
ncbi:MAG: M1 family metallopeptidase [Deltaproteobacteria bacterium]|nr:M1 family metallopeptidase [Deltaproteobacteria bacterium]